MFYIGVDIAKRAHEICFMDDNGDVLDGNSFKIPNTFSGLDKLQKMLDKYDLNPENSIVGMEATGHYWLVLYSWFIDNGFEVKVINPIVTDGYRNMLIRKVKNDSVDSAIVADVLRFGRYHETPVASEDILSLKQLCRFRSSQIQTIGDLKRKVIALVDQVFPEFEGLFTDMFGNTSIEVLREYTTPEELASVSTRKLTNMLASLSHGHFGKEKALELKTIAAGSIGIKFATDAFAFQIRQILEQIEFVQEQLQEIEAEIDSYMESLDSPITTIPGIGPVYGASILAEIGDIHRFPSGKQLVSYAGLDASVHDSGEFKGSESHISKRGSAFLRRAIWGAAFIASHSDPELSAYYQRLRARGKHHSVAVGAVARKLCYIIFAVLSENRPFEVR